ncbi:MAG: hypothetical protein AB8B88_09525 [Devosiaceae bacterium]
MRLSFAFPLVAALALAACDDQNSDQANVPELNEYDSPVPEPVTPDDSDVVADVAPTDLTPTQQAVDVVEEAAGTLATLAADQLNDITDGQPVGEAAQELVGDVANALTEQVSGATQGLSQVGDQVSDGAGGALGALSALVDDAAGAVEEAAQAVQDEVAAVTPDVDWQSTYAAEVPFYNLGEADVSAYSEAGGVGEVVGTVQPGAGGFIETCNATLDWCLIPFGEDGQSGWVNMAPFGGVAN